ncbi:hypothetical protein OAN81_07515 [Paracoccaceae bacterium]|nr:hypothetical protein [Paracoccaceae bacterium]
MSADKNSIERTKCSHCFSVVEFECGTQKVRCNKCNTLIKIERRSIEELSAKALEGIRERTQNQRINHTSGDDVSRGKKYITSTKNSENTHSIHLPADKIVICLTCSTESRIKPYLGKYRCPNCTRLLVYVKDAVSAHYVGAKEQSKRNRAKHLRQNKLSPQNKEEKQNKGRCLNCGQMLNTSSSKEICPACNTKVNLDSDFRPSEDKPRTKTNFKTEKTQKISVKNQPSAQTKYEQPSEVFHKHPLPIYVLFLAAAFPYFLIVSQLGIFDFFGIRNLSGMQKLLCFFVTAGVSIFGGVISTDDKWNDDWRKVTANYTIQSGFIIFGLIFIFHLLGTLDEETYWYD